MTLDDLVKKFWSGDRQDTRQRIAAVVEALRDELDRVVLDHARAIHSSEIDFARIYKAMLASSQEPTE